MKKITWSATVFLMALALHCQAGPGAETFTIKAGIKGNIDGKKVYLKSAESRQPLDSTIAKDGRFTFTGHVDYPRILNIIIVKNDTPSSPHRPLYQPVIPVFVENSAISISAILDSIPLEDYQYTGSGYNYDQVNIKGSAANDTYMKFLKVYTPLSKKRMDIFMNEYIKYLNPGKDKERGPVSEGVGIVTKIDQAADERNAFVKKFIRENSSNMVALYVAGQNLSNFSVSEIDEIIAVIPPSIKATEAGKKLIERSAAIKKTASDAPFADFSFNDNKGNPVKLSDHLGKGKYVLVEFWASWCGPCRADIPHLKEVYELYHPAGFEVISVSMDDDKDKWLKAIDEEKMTWLQVSDLQAFKGDLSKLYNFNGIPTCVLIDPDGKIVTRNMRGSWMDKKLIALYGNKFGNKY